MIICRRNNEIQVTISIWGTILVLTIYDWAYLCARICIRNNESRSNHFNLKNNMSSKRQQHFCQWHSMKTWTSLTYYSIQYFHLFESKLFVLYVIQLEIICSLELTWWCLTIFLQNWIIKQWSLYQLVML